MPSKRRPERERLDDPEDDKHAHLTIDEQLTAFLDQWQATRTAQVTKYRLRAERWQHDASMQLCYFSDRRTQRHYEHELKMLQELRARALDVRQPAT